MRIIHTNKPLQLMFIYISMANIFERTAILHHFQRLQSNHAI